MTRSIEPCLCGAPDCSRCFPSTYMNVDLFEEEDGTIWNEDGEKVADSWEDLDNKRDNVRREE